MHSSIDFEHSIFTCGSQHRSPPSEKASSDRAGLESPKILPGTQLCHSGSMLYKAVFRIHQASGQSSSQPQVLLLWFSTRLPTPVFLGFPCGSAGKESTGNAGDLGLIPGLGRSPGEWKDDPLQNSGLENSMDCVIHRLQRV